MTLFISNTEHYEIVINRIRSVKKTLWLGTADIKDLYIKMGRDAVPFWKQLILARQTSPVQELA
jgi:hypothetical protein